MWLADLFKTSKQDRFFALLRKHAAVLLEATKTLDAYFNHGAGELADKVGELEHEGDQIIAELIHELRQAFVTPIDRQELYALGEGIDDMIDYVNNAAREYRLFEVAATPEMLDMARILVDAADAIEKGIEALCGGGGDAYAHARDAASAENKMEHAYRAALAKLFGGDDVHTIFRLREVYRHMSNSADRADSIGRSIARVVVS